MVDYLIGKLAPFYAVMDDRENKDKNCTGMDEHTQSPGGLSKTTPSDVMQWLNKQGGLTLQLRITGPHV